jgi:hypothetical protein
MAGQQWRTARDKLRLDLFDKRLAVYSAAREFLGILLRQGHPEHGDFMPLLRARDAAMFLFDEDVEQFLERVNLLGAQMGRWHRDLEHFRDDVPQRLQAAEGLRTGMQRIHESFDELRRVMAPYMSFSQIRGATAPPQWQRSLAQIKSWLGTIRNTVENGFKRKRLPTE